jgi:NitT/TauT family transport system substrate-binding protein
MIGRRAMLASAMLALPGWRAARAQGGVKATALYVPVTDYLPAYVAQEQGFFAQHGLDMTLTAIPLIANITPAILSGQAQIGIGVGPGLLQAVDNGIDIVVVAGGTRQTPAHSTISLVARPELNIHGAADLRGRKIGVPGIASIMDVLLRAWMEKQGVSPSEATFIEVGFPQMHDVMRAHTIDAAVVIEPFRGRILADGTGTRVRDYVLDLTPDMLSSLWFAERRWAEANPQAVRGFRAALDQAIAWMPEHDEGREIEKKYLGYNAAVRPGYSTKVTPGDLAFFNDILVKQGLLQKPIDTSKLIAG